MKREKVLRIAITAGDPAGIGPEVALKAVNELKDPSVIPVIIGSASFLSVHYPRYFKEYTRVMSPLEMDVPEPGKKYLYDVPMDGEVEPGRGSVVTGRESKKYIDTALDFWKAGFVQAVVTGPVSKEYIEKSGTPFTGHTEYMAGYIGEGEPYMMMYSPRYRVLLATTHIPVSEVASRITVRRLLDVIRMGYSSMKSIDKGEIRLAIAGLDPHCGDGGAIGRQDSEVTMRAVEEARKQGIAIDGPFAADTLFMAGKWGKYNLVIAHYHDQGLIPFKMLAFDNGVNVTLGLPLTRTSVDHGTAYDIAGTDRAGYNSMTEAIMLAARLQRGKR